jgi:hypothetical protein
VFHLDYDLLFISEVLSHTGYFEERVEATGTQTCASNIRQFWCAGWIVPFW